MARAAVGLEFVEAEANGRLVRYGLSREVMRAYKNIERDYPRLRCSWDQENKEHVIAEHCRDGQHRLVLSSRHFNEDLIRVQLERANSDKFDPLKEIDEAEKAAKKAIDDRLREKIGAAGEKLAHAFAADGLTVRPRMTPLSVKMRKKKVLPNFEAPTRTISSR